MSMISSMRRRITLLGEETDIGLGGRQQKSYPLISDVWAKVEEDGSSLETRAGGEVFPEKANFMVRYSHRFMRTKVIDWKGKKYRVISTSVNRSFEPTMNFAASSVSGEML